MHTFLMQVNTASLSREVTEVPFIDKQASLFSACLITWAES